jgi:hypothetical protein
MYFSLFPASLYALNIVSAQLSYLNPGQQHYHGSSSNFWDGSRMNNI